MRLVALQSVVNTEVVSVMGYLLPPLAHRFRQPDGFPSMPSPVLLRDQVHPLMSYTSPSEYVLQVTSPTQVPNTSQGSLPLRDTSTRSPQVGKIPNLTYVSPTAFRTLSTSYSFKYLVGLFHPTATSGIRTTGVFPAAKPPRLIDEPCPHDVSESLLPASCPTGPDSPASPSRR
jgi:hypothetical protein